MSIILDMDGSIVDAVPSILRSINQALERMGYDPVGPDDIKLSGLPLKNILLARMEEDQLEEGIKLYKHIQYSTFKDDTSIFPGAREALEEWRQQGHNLGIFTLRSGATARLVLEEFDMLHMFNAVVGYDETQHPKPSAMHVQDTAAILGRDASQSLVIGDNPVDIISGRDAGSRTVGVLWGLGSKEDMEGAGSWRLAYDWGELLDIVSEWTG